MVFVIAECGGTCRKLFCWGRYPSNFHNIFTSPKTRFFGLLCGENCIIVGLSVEIITQRTDRKSEGYAYYHTGFLGDKVHINVHVHSVIAWLM